MPNPETTILDESAVSEIEARRLRAESSDLANYMCDALPNCGWRSTEASRPISSGSKVKCPGCSGAARFIGIAANRY